jgi:hypothetical protein
MEQSRTVPLGNVLTGACALLVVIGSTGPWARVAFFTKDGTDGDGVVTLILGLVAGVAAVIRMFQPTARAWLHGVILISLALSGVVGIIDWVDLERVAGESEIPVEPAWGIVLTTVAGVAGAVIAAGQIFARKSTAAPAGSTAADLAGVQRGAYCKHCGRELPDDALFCPDCGTAVATVTTAAVPPASPTRRAASPAVLAPPPRRNAGPPPPP